MAEKLRTYITRLKVRNFRSLADIDLNLEPLTVFVGQNGAGKSNIIDVLRFVRDAITRGLDNAILERNGIGALRRWSKSRPYDIEIQITLRTRKNLMMEYGFKLGSESGGEYRIKHEKGTILGKDPVTFEIRDGQIINAPKEFEKGFSLRESQTNLILPTAIYPMNDFYGLLSDLRNMGFYTIYPNTLREPQKPANVSPLDEKAQNLASVLRSLKKKKRAYTQEILDALGKVSSGVSDYSVTQVGGYLVTKLLHGKGGPGFELSQESDGTLRILGILTALYQEPPRPLIAIEEPELTIHPGALGVLCDALKEASARSQVLITTHSPDLLYHFPAESLRVVEKIEDTTQVGPVAEHQRRAIEEKLFAPGELMRIEGFQREATATGG